MNDADFFSPDTPLNWNALMCAVTRIGKMNNCPLYPSNIFCAKIGVIGDMQYIYMLEGGSFSLPE
jgi:hypothetical protein